MTERTVLCLVVAAAILVGVSSAFADAAATYRDQCAFCHGDNGKGDGPAGSMLTPKPTDFSTADYWKTADADELGKIVRKGKPGTAMVPFAGTLSDEQIDGLVDYLRRFAPK